MFDEKEQLVGFSIFIMRELGADEFLSSNSHEEFLRYPISGIRQAANDMIEACQDIHGKDLEKLDEKLSEQNLPTLTSMRQKGFNILLQIISRNIIKNEEEWYLLKSFVDNPALDESVVSKTQKLLDEFELKPT